MKARTGKVRNSSRQRKRQRSLLIWQQGPWCVLCGRLIPRADVTLDHRVPFSLGGRNHVHNLGLAHKRCNEDRGVGS